MALYGSGLLLMSECGLTGQGVSSKGCISFESGHQHFARAERQEAVSHEADNGETKQRINGNLFVNGNSVWETKTAYR
jgi:hypothetical protein